MFRNAHRAPSPLLVSFSGIDGAGKSTQITNLCQHLTADGIPFRLIAFWDEVATLRHIRELSSRKLFKGEKGVGTPEKPVNRRDKNIQTGYMSVVRFLLYWLDTISLRWKVANARKSGASVIIFDRYVYDELANLPTKRWITRVYGRILLRMVPRPDLACLLDADPGEARQRKPEYPIAFLSQARASYLGLGAVTGMFVIAPLSASESAEKIWMEFSKKLKGTSAAANSSTTADGVGVSRSGGESATLNA